MKEERQSDQQLEWAVAPANVQDSLAAFYTPRNLSMALAGWAVRRGTERTLEPAFGGCEILDCLEQRYKSLGVEDPSSLMFGCDVSRFAHSIRARRMPSSQDVHFRRQDFLTARPGIHFPRVRAVVGNPPYIGHGDLALSRRRAVASAASTYPIAINGLSNLWAHFLLHATNFLEPGGRLAFVLPLSYLYADFAAPIRQYLESAFKRVIVVELAEQCFTHASTRERVVVLLAEGYGEKPLQSLRLTCQSIPELESIAARCDSPRDLAKIDDGLVQKLRTYEDFCTVDDVAIAKLGIVTGDTDFFIGSEERWRKNSIARRYLRYILSSSRFCSGLRITDSDLRNVAAANGSNLVLHAMSLQNKSVAKYLSSQRAKAVRANVTSGKRRLWYALPLGKRPDAILPSVVHSGPKIYLLDGTAWCTNTFYELKFKVDPHAALLAALSIRSSFSQLLGEIAGRPMSQGALKFSLADARGLGLLMPTSVSSSATRHAAIAIDVLLRRGRHREAQSLVDELILAKRTDKERRDLRVLCDHYKACRLGHRTGSGYGAQNKA